MTAISKSTFQFLKDLKKNNNRDWFNDNKSLYIKSKENVEAFMESLIPKVARFDPEIADMEAKNSVFRIYRDVRFSKDKSPYKTHFGAHLIAGGRKNEMEKAGYYIHLEPGRKSILAGGAWRPPSNWIKAIRQEISYNADEFKKILNGKSFKSYFGEMQGEKLKTAPKDYPKDHPEIELLKYKDFLAVHELSDQLVLSDDLINHTAKVFKAMQPFDNFLNRSKD